MLGSWLRLHIGLLLMVVTSATTAQENLVCELKVDEAYLVDALNEVARQCGMQAIYPLDLVSVEKDYSLEGNYSVSRALDLLLEGTSLSAQVTGSGYITVAQPITKNGDKEAMTENNRSFPSKRKTLFGAVLGVLAGLGGAGEVIAQDTTGASSGDTASILEEIVVTGSRIRRDGFEAPTPVTVKATDELLKVSPGTIFEALTELPQLNNSSTSINTTHQNIGLLPGTVFNLRGLGRARTLTMMDGVRFVPTYRDGTVDADIIPQLLVDRVEIVTAGSSAVYGSDAIGGVVNFILDTDYTGSKGTVQTGVSDRGDYQNYKLEFAHGRDIGENTHLLFSVGRSVNDGYRAIDRPEYLLNGLQVGANPNSNRSAGTHPDNPRVTAVNTVWDIVPYQAVARSGPFAGAALLGDGIFHNPGITGIPTGTPGRYIVDPNETGGYADAPLGGTSDFARGRDNWTQAPETRNNTAFIRLSHDFSDSVTGFVQAGYASFVLNNTAHTPFSTNTAIFSGNPYLPEEAQQILTDTGTNSFLINRIWSSVGDQYSGTDMTHWNFHVGLEGRLNDRWDWNVRYQYGKSDLDGFFDKMWNARRFAAATDVVVHPDTGEYVCNVLLNPDPVIRERYAGCQPLAPFGDSQARPAIQWATETSTYTEENEAHILTGSIAGNLFEGWAGPISGAMGFEYRENTLDMTSNGDPRVQYDTTGLRALSGQTTRFFFNAVGVSEGAVDVAEVFGELAVPLISDAPLAQSLEAHGAFRFTDYSTSGKVETWKAGLTWTPVDDIRFRITQSRDIRAPSMEDLFQGRTENFSGFIDTHTGTSGLVRAIAGGNPNLQEEVGDTTTFGVVIQPSFLQDFSLAIDYYDVKIKDAIAAPSRNDIVATCAASNGTSPACDLIVRPFPYSNTSPENYPISIETVPVNLAVLKTETVDVEARYRMDIGPGTLNASLGFSKLLTYKTQDSEQVEALDYAGKNDTYYLPDLRGYLNLNYAFDDWNIFVQEAYISEVDWGPVFIYDNPPVPDVWYTHATISRRMTFGDTESELFLSVRNVFDKKAPLYTGESPSPGSILDTNSRVYDITGRAFTVGVRFNF